MVCREWDPCRLYFVQHGDAVPEQLDQERPLSGVGRREVEAVARLARAELRECQRALQDGPAAGPSESTARQQMIAVERIR